MDNGICHNLAEITGLLFEFLNSDWLSNAALADTDLAEAHGVSNNATIVYILFCCEIFATTGKVAAGSVVSSK